MITHVKVIVLTNIKDLNFSRVMRHGVAIRFLDAAQTPVDIVDDFHTSVQRHLEMQSAFDGSCLKEVVGPDTEYVEPAKCCGENGGIIIHIFQQYGLIEELDAEAAKLPDDKLGFFRHLADVIDMRDNYRCLFRHLDSSEQVGQTFVAESRRVVNYPSRAKTDGGQMLDRQ